MQFDAREFSRTSLKVPPPSADYLYARIFNGTIDTLGAAAEVYQLDASFLSRVPRDPPTTIHSQPVSRQH